MSHDYFSGYMYSKVKAEVEEEVDSRLKNKVKKEGLDLIAEEGNSQVEKFYNRFGHDWRDKLDQYKK